MKDIKVRDACRIAVEITAAIVLEGVEEQYTMLINVN